VERDVVRLGGMALQNGVLVHGPTAWACAVRLPDGTLRIEARSKPTFASGVRSPFLRGPARLAEAFALLPQVRRALPEAKLPFARAEVVAAMLASSVAVRVLRSSSIGPATRELAAALVSLAPAALALRGGELAAYHGAEHVSIGSYEHGTVRPKEHERCGSHLIGPLLLASAAGNTLAARAPENRRNAARLLAGVGAVAVATESFGWMTRHPSARAARALAWPGHQLQHRLATAEPSLAQLEVAEAALTACLELEHAPRPAA
jgi:uncharacterized protein YqhQ